MTELPQGWVNAMVGEVCDVVGGATPRTDTDRFWGGGIPWLTPDDLSRDRRKYVDQGRRSLSQEGLDSCAAALVPPGTVLFTSRAPIGYAAIASRPLATNQGFKSVVPSGALSSEFLYWQLQHLTEVIRGMGSGTTFPEVSKKAMATVPLVIPPLAEQERIVAAIEEAFSKLDAGEAGLRTARQLLKRTQDAILAAAVTGRLVPQDPTDTPALKVLADLGVQPLPTGDDLPEGWAVARLDDAVGHDAITDGPFGSNLKTEHYTAAGPRVVRLQNIGDGEFRDAKAFISESHFERLRKHEVLGGDLLVASLGEILPRACIAPSWLGPAIVKADCIRVRPGGAFVGTYLMLALNSGPVRAVVIDSIKGVGRPRLNLGELRKLALPVPPLEEQNRIAQEVERQVSFLTACGQTIDGGLKRSAALRRSVLKAAFEGRLVRQDPMDEPASVLLERIRAERAAAPKPKGRHARTMA